MTRLRHRLARWLVGPFLRLPETGSWMVHHDAETQTTVGIRVATWTGSLWTELASLDTTAPVDFDRPLTTGTFSGTFG